MIGIGVPIITVMDPNNPSQGVNLSYYSVPDQSKDGFMCPTDPIVSALPFTALRSLPLVDGLGR